MWHRMLTVRVTATAQLLDRINRREAEPIGLLRGATQRCLPMHKGHQTPTPARGEVYLTDPDRGTSRANPRSGLMPSPTGRMRMIAAISSQGVRSAAGALGVKRERRFLKPGQMRPGSRCRPSSNAAKTVP